MYKAAIIGERESVLGFPALGFLVREAEDAATATDFLRELAKDPSVAVIFLTEKLARDMEEEIARYKDDPLPAITVIPGIDGGTGYGMANVRRAVERAVGADILSEKN